MEEKETKTLVLELKEPRYTLLRDLSNVLATMNSLYNYYVLLADPEVQKRIEARVGASKAKDLKTYLYSSSLEQAIPRPQRMNVVSIRKASPTTISLEGIGSAIDALRRLFEMFSPVYWTMKKLEQQKLALAVRSAEIEVAKKELGLQKEQVQSFEEHLEFVSRISSLSLPADLRQYLFDALQRNMRSIELNPVKPMLVAGSE